MSFITISSNALWQQEEALVQEKVAAAGFGELRTKPGQPIEPSNQNRRADDYFPKILENESRE
jgi:hypothetical protein